MEDKISTVELKVGPLRVKAHRLIRLFGYVKHRLFPKRRQPWEVALSVAIGVFVGILPTWGFALFLTLGVLALVRLPKAPGALSSFIAIPPTIFPFFYPVGYWIGSKIYLVPRNRPTAFCRLQGGYGYCRPDYCYNWWSIDMDHHGAQAGPLPTLVAP
jgi:uncharacterized protein (DUF2062 family)